MVEVYCNKDLSACIQLVKKLGGHQFDEAEPGITKS